MYTTSTTEFHKNLANYFASKPLYLDEPTQKKPNIRKLVELPWQQTKGEMWDELEVTISDLDFFYEFDKQGESVLSYWRTLPQRYNPTDSYLKAWEEQCNNHPRGIRELKIASLLGNFFLHIQMMSAPPFIYAATEIADEILSDMNRRNNGDDDKLIINCYLALGRHLLDTNQITEAEAIFRRVLGIAERFFNDNQKIITPCLTELAWLLLLTKRVSEGETLIRRAIYILENSGYTISLEYARSLSVLGMLLHRKNELSEAEIIFTQALSTTEKVLGFDHPNFAQCISNLGMVFHANGKFSEAESSFRRSLQIMERYGDDKRIPYAAVLNNLAQLLQQLERYSEAEPLSRKQVEIFHRMGRKIGHDHPYLEASVSNYSDILQKMGYSTQMINSRLGEIFFASIPLIHNGQLLRDNI